MHKLKLNFDLIYYLKIKMNPYFYTLQQAKKQLVTNESSTTSIQQRNAKYFMPEEELKYNS